MPVLYNGHTQGELREEGNRDREKAVGEKRKEGGKEKGEGETRVRGRRENDHKASTKPNSVIRPQEFYRNCLLNASLLPWLNYPTGTLISQQFLGKSECFFPTRVGYTCSPLACRSHPWLWTSGCRHTSLSELLSRPFPPSCFPTRQHLNFPQFTYFSVTEIPDPLLCGRKLILPSWPSHPQNLIYARHIINLNETLLTEQLLSQDPELNPKPVVLNLTGAATL